MEKCDQIKILLREKGMSQKELASKLGIPMTTLSFYLTNKNKKPIPEKILKKIEIVLDFDFNTVKNNAEQTEEESTILKFVKLKPKSKDLVSELINLLFYLQDNE